jgi:type II secretory pathway pseudopilin PulG
MNKVRGIGLLELMLSLSIIAILLIMATRYYLVTSFSQKLNQATAQITQLQSASYSWKGQKGNYNPAGGTPISAPELINAGLIAQGDISSGNIVNPWSKTITIAPAADPNYVTLSFTGTSTDEIRACNNLKNAFNGFNGDTSNVASCPPGTGAFTFTFH